MSVDVVEVSRVVEGLRGRRPVSRGVLRDYVKVFFGVDVPDVGLCEGHCSPMDYLWHAYNSDFCLRIAYFVTDMKDQKVVWDKTNIGENYPGVTHASGVDLVNQFKQHMDILSTRYRWKLTWNDVLL